MTSSRFIFVAVVAVGMIATYLGYSYEAQLSAPLPQQADDTATASAVVDTAPAPAAPAAKTVPKLDRNAIPGERVLRFKTTADYQHFLDEAKKRGINVLGMIPGLRAVRVGAPTDAELTRLLQGIVASDVGPNYLVGITPPSDLPAKPKTPLQAFDQNWFKAMGVNAVDPTWGQGIKIAIVDTGVDPSFTVGGAGIPNINVLGPASAGATADATSHATAVASLIAGGDNLTGLAPGSTLLSVQALGADGVGDTFTVADGIMHAVDAGSQVINLSLGSYGDSAVLQDAVMYAEQHGVALVAASGNDGTGQIVYPAQYPGVLAVGAVDATLQPAYFSNYGTELGVMAPGVGLMAGQGNDQTISFSGTSASTATVSGALAAILSSDRTITPAQAVDLVRTYADDIGVPGADPQSGYGMVDITRVLQRNTAGIVDGAVSSQFVAATSTAGQPVTLGVTVQNRGTTAIAGGVLSVEVTGVDYSFPIQNLAPTKSVMETVPVYPAQLINSEAVISSQLNLSGSADSNPVNNNMRSRLRVTMPVSTP